MPMDITKLRIKGPSKGIFAVKMPLTEGGLPRLTSNHVGL